MAKVTTKTKAKAPATLLPLRLSRVLRAGRDTVFEAWSSADRIKRWLAPHPCTMPEARAEMRVGGPFEFCMLLPSGVRHWGRGTFVEAKAPSRLVIELRVTDDADAPLLSAFTEVDFSDEAGGTRIDIVQSYETADAGIASGMIAGATEGWRIALDQLEKEVAAAPGNDEAHAVVHAAFHLERTYDAPAARVWKALTEQVAKAKWFRGAAGRWEPLERHMDVRVGGTERLRGRWEDGSVSTYDAVYHDVVPDERLVYSYVMHSDDRRISVSLATVQLIARGQRQTTLKLCEQGAFLAGADGPATREHGTGVLLDALGASLR